jgi:Ca-activated chloride channel homolog
MLPALAAVRCTATTKEATPMTTARRSRSPRIVCALLVPLGLAACSRDASEPAPVQADASANDEKRADDRSAGAAAPDRKSEEGEMAPPHAKADAAAEEAKPEPSPPPHPQILAEVGQEKPETITEAHKERKEADPISPTQYFEHYGVNPTIETTANPISTFAVDVDTASYVMVRSYLGRAELPPEAAVRVEEVVNYFDYHYEPPEDGDFSLHAEVVPSPQRTGYHVLHLGVKAKEVATESRAAANLVFVIDVSGSMGSGNRLVMVKDALKLLVGQLKADDSVGIVAYGSSARVVLPSTQGSDKTAIEAAIDGLRVEGSTNVEAGLKLGYEEVAKAPMGAAINRVILCSDGVANVGATRAEEILASVAQHAARGITISTVGVGMGSYDDKMMEKLADKGNGNYAYIDDLEEARRVFVEHLTGTLQVVAKDVKLQIEFDPAVVARYRLLGYENRGLATEDFHDDTKDAGELGAGHTVTALYEIRLKDPEADDFGTLRVRYKKPRGGASELMERPLPTSLIRSTYAEAAPPTRLSMVAAALAEKLRGSYWVRNLGWDEVREMYDGIPLELRAEPEVAELGRLIDMAAGLDKRGDKFETQLPVAKMDFDRVPVLR